MARGREATIASFENLSENQVVKDAISAGSLKIVTKEIEKVDDNKKTHKVSYSVFEVVSPDGMVALTQAQTDYSNALLQKKAKEGEKVDSVNSEDTLSDIIEGFFQVRSLQTARQKLAQIVAGPEKAIEKALDNFEKAMQAAGLPFNREAEKASMLARLKSQPTE